MAQWNENPTNFLKYDGESNKNISCLTMTSYIVALWSGQLWMRFRKAFLASADVIPRRLWWCIATASWGMFGTNLCGKQWQATVRYSSNTLTQSPSSSWACSAVSITCNIRVCFSETHVWNCPLIKSLYSPIPDKSLMGHKCNTQLFRDDTFPVSLQLQTYSHPWYLN